METIILPETVHTIERGAFMGAQIKSIILPDSLTVIGDDAFAACVHLEKIFLPPHLTKIGARAFMGCVSLAPVSIPESVQFIGEDAFAFCKNMQRR